MFTGLSRLRVLSVLVTLVLVAPLLGGRLSAHPAAQAASSQTSPTINHLFGVACASPSTCVVVGANGALLRSTDGGSTWSDGLVGAARPSAASGPPLTATPAIDPCRIAPSAVLDPMSAFFASLARAEMQAFNQGDTGCLSDLATPAESSQISQRLRQQQAAYPGTTLHLQMAVAQATPLDQTCSAIQATVALDVAYVPKGQAAAPASDHVQLTRVFTLTNTGPASNPAAAHLTAQHDRVVVLPSVPSGPGPFAAALAAVVDRSVLATPDPARPAFLPPLAQNGFVIDRTERYLNFYVGGPYDSNSGLSIPSFITIDAGLHTFHVLFDRTLLAAESTTFVPRLGMLLDGLLRATAAQRAGLGGPDWAAANAANAAYLAVAARLLGAAVPPGSVAAAQAPVVQAEVALVRHHAGLARSPFLGRTVDYRLFAPRGHYNYGPELQSYFMAMNWLALMQAPLQTATDVTLSQVHASARRAVLLAALFGGNAAGQGALRQWHHLADPITVLIGSASGPTLTDLLALLNRTYGPHPSGAALQGASAFARFVQGLLSLPTPAYRSTASAVGRGLALFPARAIPDGMLAAALLWPNVGTPAHKRTLPSGLDVLAGLGSARAARRAAAAGPWSNYPAALAKAVPPFRRALQAPTLYAGWLAALQPLALPLPQAVPPVMHTAAWADKELLTAAASWSELRHDSILYAAQPFQYGAGGVCRFTLVRTGYVEPIPVAWQRLAALADRLAALTTQFGLFGGLPQGQQAALRAAEDRYRHGVRDLGTIAEAELRGQTLSSGQILLTNTTAPILGTPMQVFFTNTPHPITGERGQQAAEIADVATDPYTGRVLEVGEGPVQPIWLVLPIGPWQWLARGEVYSYYEFITSGQRYTDQQWQALLQAHPEAIQQPSWVEALTR